MSLLDGFKNKIADKYEEKQGELHEFCPRCEANLTLQKGYSNDLPYWICKGCGEMLINPDVEDDSGIVWICDECGAMLNIQQGFNDKCGEWKCLECGFINKIDAEEIYDSDDEYQADLNSPYKGLSDEQVLELSMYQEVRYIGERGDIILVKHRETDEEYIKKFLTIYNKSIYEYIKDNPVERMPRIIDLYEGNNCLIVIEEYIKGKTIDEILQESLFSEEEAISVTKSICDILSDLHGLPTPIVHRDIKPSNVIISDDNEVYLVDMNVAKWFEPKKPYDTHFLGTPDYAAPEQIGYGLEASSAKADIYALGTLLNVMITGKFPKEERVTGRLWDIIERCISLDAQNRYSADELKEAIEAI